MWRSALGQSALSLNDLSACLRLLPWPRYAVTTMNTLCFTRSPILKYSVCGVQHRSAVPPEAKHDLGHRLALLQGVERKPRFTALKHSTYSMTHVPESREQPSGMEQEAGLLTALQEIPNISKCWLKHAQEGGLNLTVGNRCALPSALAHLQSCRC